MTQNWQDSVRTSFKKPEELSSYFDFNVADIDHYPLLIPHRLAEKIKQQGKEGPLYQQFVTTEIESEEKVQGQGFADPIGDSLKAKGGGIIHRYENRILFTPTTVCPVNCRYCFRKNELSNGDFFRPNLEKLEQYLAENPRVNEVILTGGDPLILTNAKLRNCFQTIAKIKSVEYVRIHTRTPIVIPERIDGELCDLILEFSDKFKIIIALHVNHISEFDEVINNAICHLAKLPVTLLSQTVFLKNVNNKLEELIILFKHLDTLGVRPYYLHHPDKVLGAMHFYISESEGSEIYQSLRTKLPGWLLPHYVVDDPSGVGKKLVLSNSHSE